MYWCNVDLVVFLGLHRGHLGLFSALVTRDNIPDNIPTLLSSSISMSMGLLNVSCFVSECVPLLVNAWSPTINTDSYIKWLGQHCRHLRFRCCVFNCTVSSEWSVKIASDVGWPIIVFWIGFLIQCKVNKNSWCDSYKQWKYRRADAAFLQYEMAVKALLRFVLS